MLTLKEFKQFKAKTLKNKLNLSQALKLLESNFTQEEVENDINIRDGRTFLHKINAPKSNDATSERERSLGVKVRTRGDSERSDR